MCYPGKADTFQQIWSWSNHALPRYDAFTANRLRYIVTLTIDFLTLNGCGKIYVTQSNPPPTLSIIRPSVLKLYVHTPTVIGKTNSLFAIAHAQYHVTYLQGVDINHIFEIHDPYLSTHFATKSTMQINKYKC